MKSLKSYIQEKLIIKKSNNYKYSPETKGELREIIDKRIKDDGSEIDLNDIDVSNIKDMSYLFSGEIDFNGNISSWNVSNVTNMYTMFFACSKFNQDISRWDVSSVKDYRYIFDYCPIEEKYKPKFK